MQGLNGKELEGRTLTVNEAKPREHVGSPAAPAGKPARAVSAHT
jgi:hypothetical protein